MNKKDIKRINEELCEIKYKKTTKDNDNKTISFSVILKLIDFDCLYDSECNIFLYDLNKHENYGTMKNLIRG